MTILDRYLLRQFLQIFCICFLSLAGLYVVIDAFGHLDEFTTEAEARGSLLAVITQYYAYQSFELFDRTSGILAMVAAMFTVTWLQRHQELTAMLAAGISKLRVTRPILIAAITVSVLSAANRELMIPRFREQLVKDTKSLGPDAPQELEARLDVQTGILIGGEHAVVAERKIQGATFVLPANLDFYGKQMVAATAEFREASPDHPAGYLLKNVSVPGKIDQLESLWSNERAIIVTPRDAEWLAPGEAFVVSQLSFELLATGSAWRRYASLGEMVHELHQPSTEPGAELRVAVHTRLLQPLTDSTMLLLGLPLMFSRRDRNVFLSIGICLAAAVSFSMVILVCQSLGGLSLLRPTLAAWLPLMLFVPIAVASSHSLRT